MSQQGSIMRGTKGSRATSTRTAARTSPPVQRPGQRHRSTSGSRPVRPRRQHWATWAGRLRGHREVRRGDFDGDGHADLANVFNDQNQQRSTSTSGRGMASRSSAGHLQGDPGTAAVGGRRLRRRPVHRPRQRVQRFRTDVGCDLHRSTGWLQVPALDDAEDPLCRYTEMALRRSRGRRSRHRVPDPCSTTRAASRSTCTCAAEPRWSALSRAGGSVPSPQSRKWFSGRWGGGANLAKVFNDDGQASIDAITDTTEQRSGDPAGELLGLAAVARRRLRP